MIFIQMVFTSSDVVDVFICERSHDLRCKYHWQQAFYSDF